jgi:hypothetical protein
MNPVLKIIIETAMKYEKNTAVRDAALDEIFIKMVVRPIQLAWIRSKTDNMDSYSYSTTDTWGPK